VVLPAGETVSGYCDRNHTVLSRSHHHKNMHC